MTLLSTRLTEHNVDSVGDVAGIGARVSIDSRHPSEDFTCQVDSTGVWSMACHCDEPLCDT